MTLPQIAEYVAEKKGRQFDIPFRKQLEDAAINWWATLITDTLSKSPAKKVYYLQSILMELVKVKSQDEEDKCDPDECEEDLEDCICNDILRTNLKVPNSLKISTHPYDYVGALSGADGFGWTTFGWLRANQHSPLTGKKPKWTYINDYIYIFNDKSIKNLRIEGIFSDPRELIGFKCPNQTEPCYTKDSNFPADNKIIQQIIQYLLQVDLNQNLYQEKTEIKENKNV